MHTVFMQKMLIEHFINEGGLQGTEYMEICWSHVRALGWVRKNFKIQIRRIVFLLI